MVGVTTIIFGLIGAGILALIIYQIAKALKGSVKIRLDKNSFVSGEFVTGTVELKSRKEIKSNRLHVELQAMREDARDTVSYVKIYSQEQNLDGEKNYQAGVKQTYNFKIKVPSGSELGRVLPDNKTFRTLAKAASSIFGIYHYRWYVRAVLDAKGIDLSSKKKIYVNLSDDKIAAPTTA